MRWGGIMTTAAQAGPAGRPGQGGDPATVPDRTRRRTGLPDHGHVSARFGGIPVLVTAEMAAQIKAFKQRQP
jgi:hypothetical protein